MEIAAQNANFIKCEAYIILIGLSDATYGGQPTALCGSLNDALCHLKRCLETVSRRALSETPPFAAHAI